MTLSEITWSRCFTKAVHRRGVTYARNGRVGALLSRDDTGLSWSAEVKGSRVAPYHCEARVIPPRGRGAPTLVSSCSCPMGDACKHVAAMLSAAERGMDAGAPPRSTLAQRLALPSESPALAADSLAEWEPWLTRVATAPVDATPTQPREAFGLLIRAGSSGDPPQMLVTMVVFRRGKQAQWIEPRSVSTDGGEPTLAPEGGWPEQDQLALMLLLEHQTERAGALSFAALRGPVHERALEQLLQRYPVYFERASKPLTFAPPQHLTLRWEDLSDGRQRLVSEVAGGAVRLLKAQGLWYVDVAGERIGRILDDARFTEAIARAPLLRPEQATALRRRLQHFAAPLLIPAPTERAPPRVIERAPGLVLRMRRFVPDRRSYGAPTVGSVGVAQIEFDYGDVRLALAGPDRERLLRDGEMLEIVRDRASEAAAFERLRTLDLLPPRALPWPQSYAFHALDDSHRLLAPAPNRQPLAADAWQPLLLELAAEGVRLEYHDDFPRPLREIDAGEWDAELSEAGSAWFELALGIEFEGRRIDLLPILRQVLSDASFPLRPARGEAPDAHWRVALDEHRALRLPLARLRALLAPLLDLLQREGPLRLHRSQAEAVQALAPAVRWRGDERLRQRLVDLGQRPKAVNAPAGFTAKLRPYQREGLAWLNLLSEAGLGGVLADDMGLGKTVQVLAHLLAERERHDGNFRTLVVAPTSLMGNWRDEAARFAPDLKALVLHGPDRADRYDEILQHDLILTTYPLLPRDRDRLLAHEFDLLVLDEAQAIKNAKSQAAQVVRELRATRRLVMTGTPLENHLGELWAQFDAVEPGLLGSERDFTKFYRTPIEKHGDAERQRRLNRRIGPLMLRRRKDEVLKDLPAKTEIVRALELEGGQRELYESLRLAQHQRVREAVAERGLAQSGIVVLDALLKLRQACCDPRLVKLPAARKVKESAKLDALLELLDTLLDEGRRVLLFSQFTSMLDLIEPALLKRGIESLRLDGDTPGATRAGLVKRFQNGEAPLFLISLKAGGVGLNLTAADTVIHYDPWWNPAVEQQATDRAHRIGQNKPVFVYKLICAGTVEEKILALQTRKAQLAQAVLEGGRSTSLRFEESDLAELFAPLR